MIKLVPELMPTNGVPQYPFRLPIPKGASIATFSSDTILSHTSYLNLNITKKQFYKVNISTSTICKGLHMRV